MNGFPYTVTCLLSALFLSCSSNNSREIVENITDPNMIAIGVQRPMNTVALEQSIHRMINEYRIKKGLPPFQRLRSLDKASAEHSNYMKNQSIRSDEALVITHDRFSPRMDAVMSAVQANGVAENVGGLHRIKEEFVAQKFVTGWLNSSGHHKNVVANYNSVGISIVEGPDNTVFATQIFARIVN